MKTPAKNSRKRVITVSYYPSPRSGHRYCSVPYIRIYGKWVDRMGFAIGQRLQVTIGRNRLVISKEPE